MKKYLLLFFFTNILCSHIDLNSLVRFDEYHNTETILDQMAKMGVDFYNNKENNKFELEKVYLENVKIYGAIEKELELKILDKANTISYQKKWFEIIPEESKYLLDKSTLIEQIDEENNSTEISLLEENKMMFRLTGPLKFNIDKESNPIFELPKRLEIHSKFNDISLNENSQITLSNVRSLSLREPLPILTKFDNGLANFEVKDIPYLNLNTFNKNLKISSNEKYKLKIDNKRKTAIIQSSNPIILGNHSPIFTEKIRESYLEAKQKLKNEKLKITEISNAKYNNVKIIQIPVKLRKVENNFQHDYLIYMTFDYEKLYVNSVAPSVPHVNSVISYPKMVNETFAMQILDYMNHRMNSNL